MPFNNREGHAYTERAVKAVAPAVSGVYGIYERSAAQNDWIYVGETENIQKRLIEHLQAKGPEGQCILAHHPTGFTYDAVPADRRVARQDELIFELGPHCNKKLG
jgi:predicted GIY-YIG superfamily endonuclease